jgi:hypothetical protein
MWDAALRSTQMSLSAPLSSLVITASRAANSVSDRSPLSCFSSTCFATPSSQPVFLADTAVCNAADNFRLGAAI